jgi:chemotaxis family two-component system response regulator Rcp1
MSKSIQILLVEDNEGDIILTIEAFRESELDCNISSIKDGAEAVRYLRKEGAYHDSITPDLILLDINLPKMDGKEVLGIVKQDSCLKQIPVVMLTTSSSPVDIAECKQKKVDLYVTKPIDFERFVQVVDEIHRFWTNYQQNRHENQ